MILKKALKNKNFPTPSNRLRDLFSTRCRNPNPIEDNIYRLLGAVNTVSTDETFTYDKVGNRLNDAINPTWTYDANNRLTSYGSMSFTYDNNGNQISKDDNGTVSTYAYDYENRLEFVDGTIQYSYDPFGKRMSKTVGAVTTYYLYDSEDIIGEYDNTGTVIRNYIHGQGIDEPVEMNEGVNTYYYTMDGLGSVRDLTDSTETIVEQYSYDSFGNITTPPTTGNPYTYTAREYDAETELMFYRARYYDPQIGRFITADPIGFDGGINFYNYVGGSPTNRTDPNGLLFAPGSYLNPFCIPYAFTDSNGVTRLWGDKWKETTTNVFGQSYTHWYTVGDCGDGGDGSQITRSAQVCGCFVSCVAKGTAISTSAIKSLEALAANFAKDLAAKLTPVFNWVSYGSLGYDIITCTGKCSK